MTLRLKAFLAAVTVSVGLWTGIIGSGVFVYNAIAGGETDNTTTASLR